MITALFLISAIFYVTDPVQTSMVMDSKNDTGIKSVGIEFQKETLVLLVTLTRPMTCNQVYETLGIEKIKIGNKDYSPICSDSAFNKKKILYVATIDV
jgi:hypothetical protein